MQISRTGSTVRMRLKHLDGSAATNSYPMVGILSGFRPSNGNQPISIMQGTNRSSSNLTVRSYEKDIVNDRTQGLVGDKVSILDASIALRIPVGHVFQDSGLPE